MKVGLIVFFAILAMQLVALVAKVLAGSDWLDWFASASYFLSLSAMLFLAWWWQKRMLEMRRLVGLTGESVKQARFEHLEAFAKGGLRGVEQAHKMLTTMHPEGHPKAGPWRALDGNARQELSGGAIYVDIMAPDGEISLYQSSFKLLGFNESDGAIQWRRSL